MKKRGLYSSGLRALGMLGSLVVTMFLWVGCNKEHPEESEETVDTSEAVDRGFLDPLGMFIVNEGNFDTHYAYLLYISPDQQVEKDVYSPRNGGRPIGQIAQDMTQWKDRFYVISQNVDEATDGRLTIIEGRELKKVSNVVLESVEMPTHLVVLDEEHIYIRASNGVYRYAVPTQQLTLIEGTLENGKGIAPQLTMLGCGGKVFLARSEEAELLVIDSAKGDRVQAIAMPGKVKGLAKQDDAHIYVATDEGVLLLWDVEQGQEVKRCTMEGSVAKALISGHSTSSISSKGDTVYFGNPHIYRCVFSTGEITLMFNVENETSHEIFYQSVYVHPVTGYVYCTSLWQYGPLYITNTIYRLDLRGTQGKLINRWDDYTAFPGAFFSPLPQP